MIHRFFNTLSKWDLLQFESGEMRKEILNFLLMISIITSFLVATINIYNRRPASNILLPVGLGFLLIVLRYLSKKESLRYPIKLAYTLLVSIIYIPVAWLASPGSSSAMPMYTLLILAATVLLTERAIEFLIPIALIVELIGLLQYEAIYPERFTPYSDKAYHAFDLSVNYTAIAIIMCVLLTIVNRSFAREHRVLFEQSVTDQLTGTFNRRYLYRRLEEIHNFSRRNQQPYTVMMIDINHFKQVNDIYGHLEGDKVLRRLGVAMKHLCRDFDVVVRYGGDEFLILLPNTTGEASESINHRIQEAFTEIAQDYPKVPLALAIGTAENIEDDIDTLLLKVDNLLYHTKSEMKSSETA